ncbi:hypothetical protein [Dyadobacter aurulentus]|uniref:hypothetical protein n=1 Tax=Dyadobacter sp. UC 10 TaxID=2605428 RepID=UPI0011F2D3C6|nr:hypothetical protein [Dyadobacter sp. UC 10]KAA0992561.1 hypothetical protein FXO21_21500 [Dyadobacter sp. UC 10]
MNFITGYCRLNEDVCAVNGEIVSTRTAGSDDTWFKQIYKQHEFVYPKFYKMDLLAQAGYLTSELIKRGSPGIFSGYQDDEIAMVFSNSSSSADTDMRFLKSYEDNASPSPSLFVYTLPNIILGEVAILNKWYGENMFAVFPKFTPDFFINYINITIGGGSKAALCGWLEILEGKVDVLLFFVETNEQNGVPLTPENLTNLLTKNLQSTKNASQHSTGNGHIKRRP